MRGARADEQGSAQPRDYLSIAAARQKQVKAINTRSKSTQRRLAGEIVRTLLSVPATARFALLEDTLARTGYLVQVTPALRAACSPEAILAGARFESDVYELRRELTDLIICATLSLDPVRAISALESCSAQERLVLESLSVTFDREERTRSIRPALIPLRRTTDQSFRDRVQGVATALRQLRSLEAVEQCLRIVHRHLNMPLTERNLCYSMFMLDVVEVLLCKNGTMSSVTANLDGVQPHLLETLRRIVVIRRLAQRQERRESQCSGGSLIS